MNSRPFDQRISSIPPELLTLLTEIDTCKGKWVSSAHLGPQVKGRLKRTVLATSTGASTRIEGAMLSDSDVEKMMRGLKIQKFSNRDKQEVQGYYELLLTVFDSWQTIRFSEGLVKQFHRDLLKCVKKDVRHRGDYKKQENQVVMIDEAGQSIGILFKTTPAYLTPKEMQELLEWTLRSFQEKKYHPLLIIGNFLVEFLNIHPFQDGNGRLSRILTNLLLLKTGYTFVPYVSHEKLVEDNKPDYYLALRYSQKTIKSPNETILPWIAFFLKIMLAQAKAAVDLITGDNMEKLLSEKQLAVWRFLRRVRETTPLEICKKVNVARPTVNQVMNRLLQLGCVEQLGQGRSTRYRVV
jgi:Fic family protein